MHEPIPEGIDHARPHSSGNHLSRRATGGLLQGGAAHLRCAARNPERHGAMPGCPPGLERI